MELELNAFFRRHRWSTAWPWSLSQCRRTRTRYRGLDIHRSLLQEVMGQVPVMPLYLDVSPVLMLKGVNHSVVGATTDCRFFEWDRN